MQRNGALLEKLVQDICDHNESVILISKRIKKKSQAILNFLFVFKKRSDDLILYCKTE